MAASHSSIIELRGVIPSGCAERLAEEIGGVNLRIKAGEMVWLEGPAGEGKEAIFRLLSLGAMPEAGEVFIEGKAQRTMTAEERAQLRSHRFGYVAASPFLLRSFSAIENIAVPLLRLFPVTMEQARERIQRVLEIVGLQVKEEAHAEDLSAYEQLRLALARALANEPIALFVEDLGPRLQPPELLEFFALIRKAGPAFGCAVIALGGGHRLALAGERTITMAEGALRPGEALVTTPLL